MKYSRSTSFQLLLILWSLIAICVSGCATPEPELIPREVLFGNPVEKTEKIGKRFQCMLLL